MKNLLPHAENDDVVFFLNPPFLADIGCDVATSYVNNKPDQDREAWRSWPISGKKAPDGECLGLEFVDDEVIEAAASSSCRRNAWCESFSEMASSR